MSNTENDLDDVESRLREAMYEVNECWEHAEKEPTKAHIDDAIHHLKAAIESEKDE